ncbi:flagellar hook-length control protein FliK [Anaerovibrio lipolyticus]|uniref:flagellar hook-length control protein FliK n=1 Tax=Anaerovibrio lipolyticus TaxID=82374 RepID=UPI000488F2AA|nr:flagellar hook-length control protein FliK [Anaerovibrio lipolyticus]
MGTNVSTNLFTAAPATPQANVQQKNVNTAFEGRKASTGKQGKDFSSELKDVTKDATNDATKDVAKDDKLAQAAKEAVENPVAEKAVQKNSEKADTKPDADAKEAVAEVVDEAAEEMAAEAVATTVVQLPLAELTTSAQPMQTESASLALEQPVQIEATAVAMEQPIQQMAQVDTTAPEVSAAAQELQQPTAATQLQQQSIQTEAKAQDTAKTNVVVNDAVVTEAEAQPMAQSENTQPQVKQSEMHQPKSIEALLKPVQPVEKVTAPDGSQVVNSGDMTKEQQLLAVLSGRVVAQETKAVETAPQKTTVEDMNNLIGQQTQVVAGNDAKRGLNQDGQQSQQGFPQATETEAMAVPQSQPAESEETTFTNRMDAAQAANVSNIQTQTTDNTAQIPGQQNVSQTRADYQINQQIVEQARLLRNAENTEMVIKLNPRHLGDLTLKVAVNSNGGVTATFHTDNAQVRAMLETSMIQLQKELNEQGIKVDSVEVQTGLSDGQLPEGQSQGYYQQQQEQQNVRSQQIDLKDFEDDVENLAAEPVNKATEVIRDSEGNKISDGVDYAV